MQESSSLPSGRGVSLQGTCSPTRAWVTPACRCPRTRRPYAGTAVSPTRPLAGKDTHLSEPRAAHRKSRCLHGELCARARGPQLPTPLPHGKRAEPQRQGSWSGPLPPSSTPVPVPDCPGHPPNRHPRAGTVPLPLPPCGGRGEVAAAPWFPCTQALALACIPILGYTNTEDVRSPNLFTKY